MDGVKEEKQTVDVTEERGRDTHRFAAANINMESDLVVVLKTMCPPSFTLYTGSILSKQNEHVEANWIIVICASCERRQL